MGIPTSSRLQNLDFEKSLHENFDTLPYSYPNIIINFITLSLVTRRQFLVVVYQLPKS